MGELLSRRPIRSFVLRQGRLTTGQSQALEKHWPLYGIEYSPNTLDLDQIFGRHAPKILEIGSGMGDVTLSLAKQHPENDYLAVEVYKPGIGGLIRQADSANINNIRIICHDIVEVIEYQIENRCLDEVYIFFPDPWPKKRHHKRRLVNPGFMSLLTTKLKTHARLFIATDWRDLAEQILAVCDSTSNLVNLAGPGNYALRPYWRPLTKFEQRDRNLSHEYWDFAYSLDVS